MSNKNPLKENQFTSDKQPTSESKRKKKAATIVKEKLGLDNIEDMKSDVIRVWSECINSKNPKDKQFAAKEMSKYIFPQKRELSGELKEKIEITIHDYTE